MKNKLILCCGGLIITVALGTMPGCDINVEAPNVHVVRGGLAPAAAPAPAEEADTEMDQLVAPIALYPDPLLAQLLPATTYPDQLQQAGQWLQANPNPSEDAIAAQPWEASIKAMVHYPEAMKVLNGDPQWASSLGSAFNSDPKAVMTAIQEMREEAKSAGNLVSGPQCEVVTADAGVIAIQPANPAVLYVPTYDPVTVYTGASPLVYGVAYVPGVWLVNGVDWVGGAVFVGDWHGGWRYDGGHWGRDPYWHGYDHSHGWHHDDRFGHAGRFERGHYATYGRMRGREGEFHRGVSAHRGLARGGHDVKGGHDTKGGHSDVKGGSKTTAKTTSKTPTKTTSKTETKKPEKKEEKK